MLKVLNSATKQKLQLQIVGNNCVLQPRKKSFDVFGDEIAETSVNKEKSPKHANIQSSVVLARNGSLLDVSGINRFRYQQRYVFDNKHFSILFGTKNVRI